MPLLVYSGIGRVGIGLDMHESPYLRGGIDNDAVIAVNNSQCGLSSRSSHTSRPSPAQVLLRIRDGSSYCSFLRDQHSPTNQASTAMTK